MASRWKPRPSSLPPAPAIGIWVCESEHLLENKGVTYCATCDGALPMFRNQPLVVVGGGDSACEEAMYLTRFGSVVYLIHRRDTLRASKIMAERTLANPKIKPVWDSVVTEVLDVKQEKVTGVKVKNVKTNAESTSGLRRGLRRHRPCAQYADLHRRHQDGRRRLHRPPRGQRPIYRVFSWRAIAQTMCIARPSPLPEWAALRPSRPNVCWRQRNE